MGPLTGGLSHDFNNLLSPIIGALDLLQRKGMGSDREQRMIDGARSIQQDARASSFNACWRSRGITGVRGQRHPLSVSLRNWSSRQAACTGTTPEGPPPLTRERKR